MPSLTLPITAEGVIVQAVALQTNIRQRAVASVAGLGPLPQFTPLRLLVDTGASHSSINAEFAQALGLHPTTLVTVNTAGSGAMPEERPGYDLALVIPLESGHEQIFDPLMVIECDMRGHSYDGLLGRDVLNAGHLMWDGANRRCTLTF